ncbi:Indole-3-glycerol-phosphate synthase [Ceratobasidium theobromae]|uniref:Multifunctional tryptophan biosynthesis protein n=1 Tax=Ceratobasidium theobromae TaxID=1582974 RepID=A0A5N5QPV8_9AGAM|nr:Indole-3-glycerol-phosphate synthase [Ceratobasidium theobromae]
MSTATTQPAAESQPERIDTSVSAVSGTAGDPRSPPMPTSPRRLLAEPIETLMIDNFDSFTWNLYQSLCMLGAKVTVVRNNELAPEDFPNLRIRNLIISPGPGHPRTDSGISNDAIKYFAGRVPVLGVCMGLECLVESYGGTIEYAGEIMHGKTSPIRHDNRGCFRNLPQGIQSTRYHSLSAHRTTLPPELVITATTAESGVIMGVRHRELTLEAVQYHPESIMSEEGDALLKNFLDLQGGTWAENPTSRVLDPTLHPFSPDAPHRAPTILDKIYAQRLKDVDAAKNTPGTSKEDLQTFLSMQLAPPLISFVARLKARSPALALMAEIKRASPSKGPIAMHTNAAQQALAYALAGASVISVLTEPSWFKGTLLDMRLAREAVATLTDRPAILRKDFIVDEYQICEARLWGADTVLLIVAMLPLDRLRALYLFSLSLGMEPLVEVNNAEEMRTALRLGAKVIGVNNRNLHDFNVDMGTTSRLADMCADSDVVLCALSGISTREDVVTYIGQDVGAVLVGEALMRASDPALFIRTLLDLPPALTPRGGGTKPLVKICGVRNVQDADVAAEAGADFIGVILVPKSKRCVDLATVKEISRALRARRASSIAPERPLSANGVTASPIPQPHPPASNLTAMPWFSTHARSLPAARPLLVGVFQDQPLNYVIHACGVAGLDMVQLHGHEPVEWSRWIPVPVIRAFHLRAKDTAAKDAEQVNGTAESNGAPAHDHAKDVDASGPTGLEDIARPGYHQHILLDAIKPGAGNKLSGGAGIPVDWDLARAAADAGEIGRGRLPIILAGGLDSGNVREAVEKVAPWAVDVSGGVETDGAKDHAKIRDFVKAAKGV